MNNRAEEQGQAQGHNLLIASAVASTRILGMKVSHTSYQHAAEMVLSWAQQSLSRYVCIATVNEVMQAYDSPEFQTVMNEADLVTPDGMPLVWGLKLLGQRDSSRVYGPDLTPIVLRKAEAAGIKVGFYGGSPQALESLLRYAAAAFPTLHVAYSYSPPFRPLTTEEDRAVTRAINDSGASILFIGLNSPQQNFWMAGHRPEVRAVMLGVGAAFDFLSGAKRQAPRWMMRIGLEWLFRLITEPRRLWKRYLKHNPRFVFFFGLQLLAHAQHRLLGRPA
jgi:N-acetylglucosaminyldiphosphoundecaprenol N-acetyl-beta-D-mannosaminyltransferase